MAIDPSRRQVLLVSLIPTHMQARRCSIIYPAIFFSLTTDMNRDCQNPRVPAAQGKGDRGRVVNGVCAHFFPLLAVRHFPFVSSQWLL